VQGAGGRAAGAVQTLNLGSLHDAMLMLDNPVRLTAISPGPRLFEAQAENGISTERRIVRIKKLRLKNGYKRFLDLTIELGEQPKKIIALVGPNGCGKSSVLDGILFHANAYGQIGNKQQKNHEYHSMTGTPNFSHANIEIELTDGAFGAIRAQRRESGRESTMVSFRSPYRYNQQVLVSSAQAVTEIRLNDYGATTSSDLDDKMENNYRRLNVKFNAYLKAQDCKPSEAKAKIIGDLNQSIGNCLDLEVSSIGDIEASQGTLFFKKPDHPNEFSFNVLSSGEKEVVDILLDLYLRRDDFAESIFLLDEPELHINTGIQKKLLIGINRMVGADCQIWLTTHSIGFLRALKEVLKDDCQIVQFEDGLNLASRSHVLTPITPSAAKWREIFAIALDDLSELVSPKQIIYCEGRDLPGKGGSERGLDAKVFNNIFPKKHHDAVFVSSGGNTELDQRSGIALAILTKVLPTVEILVLKDRDIGSGRATTEAERILYLENNPIFHRVLKRWEIENYLYDKRVLQKYCSDRGLNFDEQAYDSFVTNVCDQNLKDETPRIRNICGITTSINPEVFKLSLSKYLTEDLPVYAELEDCIFNRG
jgi:hypothetical protein